MDASPQLRANHVHRDKNLQACSSTFLVERTLKMGNLNFSLHNIIANRLSPCWLSMVLVRMGIDWLEKNDEQHLRVMKKKVDSSRVVCRVKTFLILF